MNSSSISHQSSLPTIRDMYNCTRENYDYNVIKKYEGGKKSFAVNSKPTKKSHYLDTAIKNNVSPGPANNSNHQINWAQTSPFQIKHSERITYLGEITKQQKKLNLPSSNKYNISMHWPEKIDQIKHCSQKINFADTCQYESNQIPGPGTYNIRTHMSMGKLDKKWSPHQPIQTKEAIGAEVGSYSPCPLEYNTFDRYQNLKKTNSGKLNLKRSPEKQAKEGKENSMPGPGAYTTISYWPGKSKGGKNQHYYFSKISKGHSANVYH